MAAELKDMINTPYGIGLRPRRYKILRINRADVEDDIALKTVLERFFDKNQRTPLTKQALKNILDCKYRLPKGTEICEIVDTSDIATTNDYVAVAKLYHPDFPIIPKNEYLPIFNPAFSAETKFNGRRRKPLIII